MNFLFIWDYFFFPEENTGVLAGLNFWSMRKPVPQKGRSLETIRSSKSFFSFLIVHFYATL